MPTHAVMCFRTVPTEHSFTTCGAINPSSSSHRRDSPPLFSSNYSHVLYFTTHDAAYFTATLRSYSALGSRPAWQEGRSDGGTAWWRSGDKALPYNADTGFPPRPHKASIVCQVFVLEDGVRKEKGMWWDEWVCVVEAENGRVTIHCPAVWVKQCVCVVLYMV